MSLENIKKTLYFNIEQLFAEAAVDEASGDTKAYHAKLVTIAAIAELLGMKTKLTTITLDLWAPGDTEGGSVE